MYVYTYFAKTHKAQTVICISIHVICMDTYTYNGLYFVCFGEATVGATLTVSSQKHKGKIGNYRIYTQFRKHD